MSNEKVKPTNSTQYKKKIEVDYNRCPKHGTKYAAGSMCPACLAEQSKNRQAT